MVTLTASGGRFEDPVPGHRILGKLGKESSTTVYKARQISSGRIVAIKVLPKNRREDQAYLARFTERATLASIVNHSNIIETIEAGKTADGFCYLVVEYAEGMSLLHLMLPAPGEREGPLPCWRCSTSVFQFARG